MDIERIFHQDLKYHYKIVNKDNILAESDYYDYLVILLTAIRELHQGICDPNDIIIIKEVVDK